ncbi:MAG TPA: MotA/TolQ/ExbB proton channel family protein [Bacteroidetes bacterium]|nr:biopolymer transport protein ExbB [bacterium BMS3Bbin04]HDO64717.1 MotA/TolQ/ExbB proton channel family protein [Bacteroidota bacterium]HEX03842.1 MotA/TolQ/ExbB proton channel family protein [Bacteroidota bacterium]
MVELFLRGGEFMWPILAVFIIGLMFVIERFVSLTMSTVNTKKFIVSVTQALEDGGPQAAKEICEKTRGPIASVFHAGLQRFGMGIDAVEKNIMNAGQIEMSFLEKNLVWLSTVIAIAPMLGFTGTVAGMVGAFDAIAAANDISPAIVAGGISKALLTTLFGLIVAMVIQFFNNFFISRIDKIVGDMQEASVEFVDTLLDYEEAHPELKRGGNNA